MKRILILLSVSLFGFFQPVNSGARPASSQELKDRFLLQHQATVTLKLIQVIVTDKKGNPITDLGKEDFTVSDNGEEKKITEFERHSLSVPASETPAVERKATSSAPTSLLGRKFFFLFDAVLVDVKGFRIARDAALRFIQSDLLPEDEVAVLSFLGGRSLRIHESLTQNHAAALSAIGALSPGTLMKQIASADLGNQDEIVGVLITGDGVSTVPASSISSGARIIAGNFIWAMRSLAQATRYIPGKKHLILYSNGIPGAVIGRGEYAAGRNTDLGRDYTEMCNELAASNISVYPVNTADINIGLRRIDEARWKEALTGVPSLREMASHTGGRFLGPADNAAEHMEKVNTLTGTYYVIGYPIGETWDGKYHNIRVKVRRPGAEVNAQPGYFNPKPFSEYSELEKKIDLVDLALADKPLSQEPVRFAVRALPGAGVPPDNLHFIAEVSSAGLGDIAGRRVEFVSILFDALDQIIDLKRVELNLTSEALGRNRAFLFSALSATPGTYKCRIVLRNMETGRAAVAGSTHAVPDREPGKVVIFPPLFVVSSAEALYLGGGSGKDGQGDRSRVLDQIVGALLFDPKEFCPWLNGPLQSHSSLFASLQCASADGDTSKLSLSASLTDESAGTVSAIPLTVLAEKEGKGTKTFFVRLDIPEVEWGAYILGLVATDRARGLSSRVTQVISIE